MTPEEREKLLNSMVASGAYKNKQEAAAALEFAMALAPDQGEEQAYLWLQGTRKKKRRSVLDPVSRTSRLEEYYVGGEGKETLADEVRTWVYDPDKRADIVKRLVKLGFPISSFEDVEKAWFDAVDRATAAYMGSGKNLKLTPWDMLDLIGGEADGGMPWRGKSFSRTTTTKNIDEIGPEAARDILERSLTELLGRAPSDEEIEDFASRANAIVSANPSITESTTTYEWDPEAGPNGGEYVATGTVNRQTGTSAEETAAMIQNEARDRAMESPEYGEFQASTNIYNWLIQGIQSVV